jgi:hypothetical protein
MPIFLAPLDPELQLAHSRAPLQVLRYNKTAPSLHLQVLQVHDLTPLLHPEVATIPNRPHSHQFPLASHLVRLAVLTHLGHSPAPSQAPRHGPAHPMRPPRSCLLPMPRAGPLLPIRLCLLAPEPRLPLRLRPTTHFNTLPTPQFHPARTMLPLHLTSHRH